MIRPVAWSSLVSRSNLARSNLALGPFGTAAHCDDDSEHHEGPERQQKRQRLLDGMQGAEVKRDEVDHALNHA